MTTKIEAQFGLNSLSTRHIPVVLLVGGALNGFAVRIMESARNSGADTILFGISPFELIALGVAAALIWRCSEPIQHHVGWPEALALAAFLLPSSALAWIGVMGYAAYIAQQSQNERRLGALLFVALAATALWSSVFIKWFAAPITSVEAHVVVALLAPLRPDVSVSANLMGVIGGHQVLLLAACSSAYLIPKAIVALAALITFMGSRLDRAAIWKLALATAAVLALANWVRLAIMTWSDAVFQIAHGPIGANVFDLLQTMVILAAGMWASR